MELVYAKFALFLLTAGFLYTSADAAITCYQCSNGGKSCDDLKDENKKKDMKRECPPIVDSCDAISTAVYEGRKLTHYIETRDCHNPESGLKATNIVSVEKDCIAYNGTFGETGKSVTRVCSCKENECNGNYVLRPPPIQTQKCYRCSTPSVAGLRSCAALNGTDDAEKKKLIQDCGNGDFICEAYSLSAYRGDKINSHLEVRGCAITPKEHTNKCAAVKDNKDGDRIVEIKCQCNDKDNCNDANMLDHPKEKGGASATQAALPVLVMGLIFLKLKTGV